MAARDWRTFAVAFLLIESARWEAVKWFADRLAFTPQFVCDAKKTDPYGCPDVGTVALELLEADSPYLCVCVCVYVCLGGGGV